MSDGDPQSTGCLGRVSQATIGRLRRWWGGRSSWADSALEGKVIINRQHWDGFPANAAECRRRYTFSDGVSHVSFANVNCPTCGDPVLRHDYSRRPVDQTGDTQRGETHE